MLDTTCLILLWWTFIGLVLFIGIMFGLRSTQRMMEEDEELKKELLPTLLHIYTLLDAMPMGVFTLACMCIISWPYTVFLYVKSFFEGRKNV